MGATEEQRSAALVLANTVRTARVALKRDLRDRSLAPSGVLEDPPAYALSMRVETILAAPRMQGRVKARRHLVACQIGEGRTVGELTDRQRAALVYRLRRVGL